MTPTKTPRERFEQMKLQDDITFVTHKMSAKLGDVAIDDMWECVWSHVSALLEEARQETKEKCAKKAFDFADNLEKKTGVDASYARAVGNLIQSL